MLYARIPITPVGTPTEKRDFVWKGRRIMKMKRVLAFALLMTVALTSLGFGPALAVETGDTSGINEIAAQWANKEA